VQLSGDNRTILNLPAGHHTLRARAFGWEETTAAVLISEHTTTPVDIVMRPAVFRMVNATQSRRQFNPMNASYLGINEYHFEVSAPGFGNITIRDKNGTVVYTGHLNQFNTWVQYTLWNGRDSSGNPLPEGIYSVVIEGFPTGRPEEIVQIRFETEINYSINIFPLSLTSGISGLIFAPAPDVLPVRSYQLEAGINYGFFSPDGGYKDFPFGIGFRISPLNKLETSAFFNINPRSDGAGWGIAGSLKYNFIAGFPVCLSAGASYTWANDNGENPLGPGNGVGLYVPFSLNVIDRFSIIFTPGVFWQGPEGLVPLLLLSAGVHYQGNWINTGFSTRAELDFREISDTRLFAGAEARFYPHPSILVFSVQAGFWTQNSKTGGYGGIGIGIIH
jgi:hypothetical protein